MWIDVLNRFSTLTWLCALILPVGSLSGCAGTRANIEEPRATIIEFKTPGIFLHIFENSGGVKGGLKSDGPRVQTRQELGNANGDFVLTGKGVVHWGEKTIVIRDDAIVIDGVWVEAGLKGYLNVTIAANGEIQKGRFSLFESPRGYHPAK